MLSSTLEVTLRKALGMATDHKHEYATYEHLLLALLEDDDAREILLKNKVDCKDLQSSLSEYLKNDLEELVTEGSGEAKPTAGFQRIIQRAALHSQALTGVSEKREIHGGHLLAEFFFEHESFALKCLKDRGVTRHDILKTIKGEMHEQSTGLLAVKPVSEVSLAVRSDVNNANKADPKTDHNKELKPAPFKIEKPTEDPVKNAEEELAKYCINLNEKAKGNDIDCLVGRQNEIQRTIEILCRRKKNNAILVGEPGVGKTAIAEGLAYRIVQQDVPKLLESTRIYALDLGALVAGTKYRGDFEERINSMLGALKEIENAILFIDEIHSIIGAGSTTNGSLDASNLLKPALARGELKCIGSTTFKEYHNHFEKDMALVRRFQKIVVKEPDEEGTLLILQGLKGYYEKHHDVTYDESALKAAISLSQRYINDRHLPDKAIDLIDEAGARGKISNDEKNKKKKRVITEKDIEKVVTTMLNIPNISVVSSEAKQLKRLESNLKNAIFGQDEAISNLCASIRLSRAGLKKGTRPTGCYLFAGQTGVGKTELARQLANLCSMKLVKFDMSEFAESASVSKLLGSAPGYVGFDQGGLLTEEVNKYPYSVVLFDEIEKAHPDIYNLLLQIMDEGNLTDSTGKNIDFTHTMIILTTNLQAQKQAAAIGFSTEEQKELPPSMEQFENAFSPEFRGRLDKIILFNPIDNIVDKIVEKNFKELAAQLADRRVNLRVAKAVTKHLVQNCFSKRSGARELDKIIDAEIKQHIADEILFGRLQNGGSVVVDMDKKNGEITFKFTKLSKGQKEEAVL